MTEIAGESSPGESRRPSRGFDNCSLATHSFFLETFGGVCVKNKKTKQKKNKNSCPPTIGDLKVVALLV